jgi:imidazolonepropionase-like amidohydrolase
MLLAGPGRDVAPPEAPRVIILKARRLFDGRAQTLISPGFVSVRGNRIVHVGATGATIPRDAITIDLGDATLLPGFIDAHTHLSTEDRQHGAHGG